MNALRKKFLHDALVAIPEPRVLVTVTKLPSGAFEIVANTMELQDKLDYIIENYDNDFRLVSNTQIEIVAYCMV